MKYDVAITNIGSLAPNFLENSSSIILLDEGVRPNLTEMVVEHTAGELTEDIQVGDTLTMGAKRKFKVVSVGEAVNVNLRKDGHCTVVINAEGSMPGQLIVKGSLPPRLNVGDKITIE
ncbi:PTS glucitol/sorbitol transporter subunit IIA [uncultured Selenomonas sp.]|uniref:PTS glucitol/sorbitol transporter subunit IIA n=1 Tax=uncultured Selenomonas sp. TaxID=159275 RepID=UPI0028DB7C81|nr:PTS glucitol/sorbitol transporter subunit IIA [uncultured Selenomonas sp.]